jgi:type II secretory pathway pseudopilin PulG
LVYILLDWWRGRKRQVMRSQMGTRLGVTMMELIMAIAVMALLAVLLVPGLGSWLAHYRVKTAARDFVNYMQRARYQAIQGKTQGVIRFEQVNIDGRSYDYFAFLDANGDYRYVQADGDTLIGGVLIADYGSGVEGDPYPPNFGTAGAPARPCISFNARGLPESGTAPMTAQQSAFFRNSRNQRYSVNIQPTGAIELDRE